MGSLDAMIRMAGEMWEALVTWETEKYDLEERMKRQDYDLKELRERQRQQLRARALKLGLDPEALTGKHPPKVKLASKFERRVDTRSFEERIGMLKGGWVEYYQEVADEKWQKQLEAWESRTRSKLPRWFGENPGRKPGDPETPEADENIEPPEPLSEEEEEEEEEEPEPEPEEGEGGEGGEGEAPAEGEATEGEVTEGEEEEEEEEEEE